MNLGKLFIASSFNLSTARVYFSVCFSPECPKRLATVFILAPLLRMFTANECRAVWKVIGYARKSRQKKIKRKPFEMSMVSVFCQIEKMQMTT